MRPGRRARQEQGGDQHERRLAERDRHAIGRSVTPAPSAGSKTVIATTARSSTSEDADHDAAVARVQLAAVHEQPDQHHRAGHGDDESDGEPLPGGQPSTTPAPAPERGREHDAQRSAEQRDPPDAQQVAQPRTRCDREHQQDDPDLGDSSKVWVSDTGGPGVKRPTRMPPTT